MSGLASHKWHVKIANHLELVYKGRQETTCDAWKAQNCCSCVCRWCPSVALTCPTGGSANLPGRRREGLAGAFGATGTPPHCTSAGRKGNGRHWNHSFFCSAPTSRSAQKKPLLSPLLLCSFFWCIQVAIQGNLPREVGSAFRTWFQHGSTQRMNATLLN